MAGHAQLKFVMTECSKTQIRLAGLISNLYKHLSFFLVAFIKAKQKYAFDLFTKFVQCSYHKMEFVLKNQNKKTKTFSSKGIH